MIAPLAETPNAQVIAVAVAGFVGIGSIIGLLFRSIIKYLFDRIGTLEKREETILTRMVDIAESQQASLTSTAEFVQEMTEERRYEQRRRREEGGVR